MNNYTICLDAGHGGNDPGATANNLKESEINLDVTLKLGNILQKQVKIIYTRTENKSVDINTRANFANANKADYFISIHTNASSSNSGTGAETLIKPNDATAQKFATAVNDFYCAKMGLKNRGIKLDTTTRHGSLGVLRGSKMPSMLIEIGFIDSPVNYPDVDILRNQRQKIAETLAEGILQVLGLKNQLSSNTCELVGNTDKLQVEIFGEIQELTAVNIDGKNYVGLREIGEKLGFTVDWDDVRKMPVVISKMETTTATGDNLSPVENAPKLTFEEMQLLTNVVHWESRGEDEIGQTLVANVILNRLKNNPNATLNDIIFQPGAFSVVNLPNFDQANPNEQTQTAVQNAMGGTDYSQGATFFHSLTALTPNSWHEIAVAEGKLTKLFDHGNHRFYKGA
ncbi:MAG: N-acetylmuramoyl-L-alanine amidase [Firmicutes bacterium]|nr:N-acetylmuramoyl-L-alanine amidase [Bacillota bacterium]